MKTRTLIVIAIVLMAAAQIACAGSRYSAEIGAVQTPQPAPTAAPPQVIVVDRPVPTESHDNGALIVIAVILLAGTMMASGALIGYIARGQKQQPAPPATAEPTSLTLTTNNYFTSAPQLSNFEQYQLLKQRGFSPQIAQQIIAEGRANQFLLPPGQ